MKGRPESRVEFLQGTLDGEAFSRAMGLVLEPLDTDPL